MIVNKWDRQRAEALVLAQKVTREEHAKFTFVEGYVAAHEVLGNEIADLKVKLAFAVDKINQLKGTR